LYYITHTHTHTYTRTHKLNKHETQITVLISGLNYKESAMFKKKQSKINWKLKIYERNTV